MANQHMLYIPKRRLDFSYLSGDGPLSLVFEASEELQKASIWRPHNYKITLATMLPALYMA